MTGGGLARRTSCRSSSATSPGNPVDRYDLSYAFRFGPMLAQAALNAISLNSRRAPKTLVARDPFRETQEILVTDREDGIDADTTLADEIVTLRERHGVPPGDMIVLGRMRAQFSGLEVELLRRRITHQVLDNHTFFSRPDIAALLSCLLVAARWRYGLDSPTAVRFREILNKPNRKVSRERFGSALDRTISVQTVEEFFAGLLDSRESKFVKSWRGVSSVGMPVSSRKTKGSRATAVLTVHQTAVSVTVGSG
jgi:superfamily I DNA/RNA helicase